MVRVQGHRTSDLVAMAQKVALPPLGKVPLARALLRTDLAPFHGETSSTSKKDTIDLVPSRLYPFAGASKLRAQSNV